MKIGIYSDCHFCKSSSILVGSSSNKYSMRLDFLIKSFKWMYDLFEKNEVYNIFNLGDLISSDVLDAETNSALSEALRYSKGTQEYWLIGNHEKKSRDSKFHSLSLIKQYPNIKIIDDFEIIDLGSLKVLMKSFTSSEHSLEEFQNECKLVQDSSIVMTHQVYKDMVPGMVGYDLDYKEITKNKNILNIFNGHIHSARNEDRYCQVGSISGMSFGDDYSQFLPGVVIYDCDTNTYERYINPYATLFYTLDNIDSIDKFIKELTALPELHKLLRIRIPISFRESFSNYLNENSKILDNCKVLSYRLKLINDNIDNTGEFEIESKIQNCSVIDSLKDFTNKSDTPYSKEDMIGFINEFLSI